MDDDVVASQQARGLCSALEAADIGVGALWLHYFRLGGEVGEVEIDPYLHHALGLPRFERDLLAQAANELLDHGPGPHAPSSSEVLDGARKEKVDGTEGADGDGGADGAAQL